MFYYSRNLSSRQLRFSSTDWNRILPFTLSHQLLDLCKHNQTHTILSTLYIDKHTHTPCRKSLSTVISARPIKRNQRGRERWYRRRWNKDLVPASDNPRKWRKIMGLDIARRACDCISLRAVHILRFLVIFLWKNRTMTSFNDSKSQVNVKRTVVRLFVWSVWKISHDKWSEYRLRMYVYVCVMSN